MSAKALDNYRRMIVIQDELEAFFHVMLYIALRVLPHNCPVNAVPRLLRDYFDDYAFHEDGNLCGATKRGAMESGRINIAPYNPQKEDDPTPPAVSLHFVWPNGLAKDYPLDTVVTTILSWLSAYYRVTLPSEKKQDTQEPVMAEGATFIPGAAGLLGELTAPEGMDEEPPRASTSASPNPNPTIVDNKAESSREDLEELAKKLESHQPLLQLLWRTLQKKEWPKADLCSDRKPDKNTDLQKERGKTGSKRGSEMLESAASSSKPTKRVKP